jgi:hypothetical protein
MLIGEGGTYVRQVDGRDVEGSRAVRYAGGNTTRVAPGRHRLKVYVAGGGERASALWEFDFDAAPATAYRLFPGAGSTIQLQVRDDRTGVTRDVD